MQVWSVPAASPQSAPALACTSRVSEHLERAVLLKVCTACLLVLTLGIDQCPAGWAHAPAHGLAQRGPRYLYPSLVWSSHRAIDSHRPTPFPQRELAQQFSRAGTIAFASHHSVLTMPKTTPCSAPATLCIIAFHTPFPACCRGTPLFMCAFTARAGLLTRSVSNGSPS